MLKLLDVTDDNLQLEYFEVGNTVTIGMQSQHVFTLITIMVCFKGLLCVNCRLLQESLVDLLAFLTKITRSTAKATETNNACAETLHSCISGQPDNSPKHNTGQRRKRVLLQSLQACPAHRIATIFLMAVRQLGSRL